MLSQCFLNVTISKCFKRLLHSLQPHLPPVVWWSTSPPRHPNSFCAGWNCDAESRTTSTTPRPVSIFAAWDRTRWLCGSDSIQQFGLCQRGNFACPTPGGIRSWAQKSTNTFSGHVFSTFPHTTRSPEHPFGEVGSRWIDIGWGYQSWTESLHLGLSSWSIKSKMAKSGCRYGHPVKDFSTDSKVIMDQPGLFER